MCRKPPPPSQYETLMGNMTDLFEHGQINRYNAIYLTMAVVLLKSKHKAHVVVLHISTDSETIVPFLENLFISQTRA